MCKFSFMEEWKEYKLGEICTALSDGLHKAPKFMDGGEYIFVNAKNIVNGFIVDNEPTKKTTHEEYLKYASPLNETSVLYSIDGTIGNVALYRGEKCVLGKGACYLNPNPTVLERMFLYYELLSPRFKSYIDKMSTGSTIKHISLKTMREYVLSCPTIETQYKISSILKSLDDKIDCNRRINDNLEQQAQALFKSWFVDFEPFKDGEFVESEMGRIPKNLLIKRVSEIPHTIETGRRPKGGVGEISSGVPSVGAEHVKGLGNYDYSKTKYITEEYAASLKTGKVNGYELLIYKDGGKPGYFIPNYSIFGEGYPFEECFLNEHVFKLDFGDKGYNAFCYFYFWTDYVMNYLNAQGGKAAIPGINRQDIENIQIYAPENELVKRFGDIVLPSIRQILFNCKETRRLAQLRDTLLPRLMSGEININEIRVG